MIHQSYYEFSCGNLTTISLILLASLFMVACFKENVGIDYNQAALINVKMGMNYLEQGQVARAKGKFLHALELSPKLPEAHSAMGHFLGSVGNLQEAKAHFCKAIDYGKGRAEFYNEYGLFLYHNGRYLEADSKFLRAIQDKKNIKTADVYENAGLCALRTGEIEKARGYLRQAQDESGNVATAKALWLSIQINQKLNKQEMVASDVLQLKTLFVNSMEYKLYLESIKHG